MKDLFKQVFKAGRDFGHAMGTGRPTYGLTFEEWYSENEKRVLSIANVSNRLLAEKIILALDDYGRKVHSVEYGLPIDPDTKSFEDKRPQEMLKIVTDILND